ncbi:MAG: hypothetical protein HY558_03055 [Euryarchaeota archaeon]|nr:hypothetical protein [Euryarchaeota archaeon]
MGSRSWRRSSGVAWVALFLVAFSTAAQSGEEAIRYSADYEIQEDLMVQERLTVGFLQPPRNETLRYLRLPSEVASLRVTNETSPLKFQTTPEGGGSLVSVTLPPGSRQLRASFTTREPIFSRGGEYRFFASLRPPGGADRVDISVTLPPGVSLLQNRVLPSNATVGSDGRRATLRWTLTHPSGEVTISVPFVPPTTPFPWLQVLAGVLGASSGGLFLLYFHMRMTQERLRGFSEDEQKVLRFLKTRQEAYQEEVKETFGFSMAKVSRMVKRLEASGLVEKKKIGRSNRLFWKKP